MTKTTKYQLSSELYKYLLLYVVNIMKEGVFRIIIDSFLDTNSSHAVIVYDKQKLRFYL